MTVSLRKVIASKSPRRQAKIKRMAAKLIAAEKRRKGRQQKSAS